MRPLRQILPQLVFVMASPHPPSQLKPKGRVAVKQPALSTDTAKPTLLPQPRHRG